MQDNKTNPILNVALWIIRIAVGGLFIFSGLVKANDPKGLAYKMGEFFEAWAMKDNFLPDLMHWLNQYALEFAILMIVLEIVAGVALIIGYRFKFFSWLIFLLTAFFTFLTAYVLFSGNIKACGCFGDCIPLTPNETFTKDIILMVLITILLLFRTKIKPLFHSRIGNLIMIATLALAIFMNFDVLKNLPYNDCLPYKKGNNITDQMTPGDDYEEAKYDSKLVYENLQSGEKKEFGMDNIPWQDTLTWKYDTTITTLIQEAINEPKILDFAISDYDGNDVTQNILNYSQSAYVVFIKDVKTAKTRKMEDLRELVKTANANNIPVFGLSASSSDMVAEFKTTHKLDINFYQIDGTVCKTAMRSNPGLMLLKAGTVGGKWSYNNISDATNFKLSNPANIPVIPPPVINTDLPETEEEEF